VAELRGISHVSLTVRDLGRSERWYAEVLGMVRIMAEAEPDHEFVVLLHPPSGTMLGLHTHAANDGTPASEHRTGLDHVGFAVADRAELEAWADVLVARGVRPSAIVDAPYGHGLSFRDPDDIPLELFCLRS
jgi:catechol 2,3-dioxygenase-like lactoylglutathione lyase family enzyme